jgi:hypothetical protein
MRIVGLLGLVASVTVLVVGSPTGPGGDLSLEEARSFEEFPLYYAGDEVDGLPLAAVLRRDEGAEYVSFVYGECGPSSDSGCAPPAEVQVWPAGVRNAGSYEASAGAPSVEPTRIRGRPAAFVGDGTQLELYTEESTIVVFADTRQRLLAVANVLRCLGRDRDGPREERLGCRR